MIETLLEWDHELFLYLNGLGTPSWDTFWQFISHKLSAIPIYLFLLLLSYQKYGLKKTVILIISVALLITVSDQLSNFFKYGLGRLRPCHDPEFMDVMRLVKSRCGGKFSYFSAHAANSFALAIFFWHILKSELKSMSLLVLIWACLVAYSRVYIGVHFPLDILTGALLGSLFGWLFSKLFIFVLRKISL